MWKKARNEAKEEKKNYKRWSKQTIQKQLSIQMKVFLYLTIFFSFCTFWARKWVNIYKQTSTSYLDVSFFASQHRLIYSFFRVVASIDGICDASLDNIEYWIL